MANNYRIAQTGVNVFQPQIATASGWTNLGYFNTLAQAVDAIQKDKDQRAFVPTIFDETGLLMADTTFTPN